MSINKGGVSLSKQRLIIQKAIELFSQKTIAKTSIQDITEACGISKGAFYLSFRSKEELLIAIVDQLIQDQTIAFQKLADEDSSPRDKLSKFCSSSMHLFNEQFPLFEMLLTENLKDAKAELLQKVEIFNRAMNDIIITLLQDTYGEKLQYNKYDIHLCLKGLIHSYTDFTIHHRKHYDFKKIAELILHYIDVLVEHQFEPFVEEEQFLENSSMCNKQLSIRQLIMEELTRVKTLYDKNSFFGQSIHLLENEFSQPIPSAVLLNGMAANIQHDKELQWLSTLVKQFSPLPHL